MELPPRVDSTFRYVLLAARRAEQLMRGAVAKVPPSSKPTRTAMAELADDPDALYRPGEEPRVLSMGGGVKIPRTGKRQAPVSVDVGNRVEALLGTGRFDIVHVHDPFVPGFSSTALRHSFSLNVGTFHETEERPFATQFARPLLEIFFGRLDARTTSSKTSAKLLNRYFPGSYEITHPGVDPAEPARVEVPPLKIAFSEREEPGRSASSCGPCGACRPTSTGPPASTRTIPAKSSFVWPAPFATGSR